MEIKIQATVVEYLIRKADVIFNDKLFPDVPGRCKCLIEDLKNIICFYPSTDVC